MKRALTALIAAPLLLAGCTSEPASVEPQTAPESLELDKETSLGIDLADSKPSSQAVACEERPVLTTDGYVSLKNVELDSRELLFYFAPNGSVYNSYIYNVHFDDGELIVKDASGDAFEVKYRAIPSAEWNTLNLALSNSYYGQSFEIPESLTDELGTIKRASASVNGEHAGTCKFE